MFVKFLELKYKNFLSFGSVLNTITFEEGINLFTGKNGSGKSGGLLDPLSFCLFGRPYRKIKINQLINRINKKSLFTECSFQIDKNIYKIIRTLRPGSLKILKNNEEQELLSSKRLIQDEIDKILGIDYTMFKQIISLAVNYNKPYLAMEINEKRDVIESIFNVKIFGEMLRLLKTNLSHLKTRIDINKQTVKILEENLITNNKRLKEIKKAKDNFESDKQNDLQKIKQKVKECEKIISKSEATILKYENEKKDITELNKNRIEKIENEKKENKKLNIAGYNIKNSTKTKKLLEKNDICPVCNNTLIPEHKKVEIEKLNTIISKNQEMENIYRQNINLLLISLKEIELELEYQKTMSFEMEGLKEKIKWNNDEIKYLTKRQTEIENRVWEGDVDKIEDDFKKKTREYKKVYNQFEEQTKELKISEITSTILSDNGIKAYFFKKLMPLLNIKINEYIKKFNLPIKIEINEFLEDKIYGINSLNEELSYWSHSEGEKKRIDVSILLAFIDITKIICNWDCSLLIIDELLDNQVDEDGLEIMLASLKDLFSTNRELSIYIISHRTQLQEADIFNKHYKVSMASGFSKMERIY